MLIIGLTGGIGSGKSTVAHLFAKYNIPIIDADIIAHELTQPNKQATAKIAEHFGHTILLADGTLNRSVLRQVIFNNPHERHWLEHLLHPLIRDEIEHQVKMISAPYCIVVIPLLLEVEPYPFIQRILVVDAPEEMQIKRVISRDNTQASHVQSIMNTQIDRQNRLTKAHDVIMNDGSLADLALQVENLHNKYLKIAANVP